MKCLHFYRHMKSPTFQMEEKPREANAALIQNTPLTKAHLGKQKLMLELLFYFY